MQIIYSDQPVPVILPNRVFEKSVFLAGPTPRDPITPSWRPTALEIFEKNNFTGTVFVPERSVKTHIIDYVDQVEWEDACLRISQVIVFWIPRNLVTMPALTTNVEFGRFAPCSQTLYGRPDDSEKNRYLDWYYTKYNGNAIYNNLNDLITNSIKKIL